VAWRGVIIIVASASTSLAAGLSVLVLTVGLAGVVWVTINAVVDNWPQIQALIDDPRSRLPRHLPGSPSHRRGGSRPLRTACCRRARLADRRVGDDVIIRAS
jgi:hypothetical protein